MKVAHKAVNILIPIFICFLVGYTASLFQEESIRTWYPTLIKPSLTPPNYVFPIAWSIIYLLMGVSIGLILNSVKSKGRTHLITIFILQLFLNFSWSLLFFYCQSPLLGFINIILLYLVVLWYIVSAFKQNYISALLFIPYILWLTLATYLNTYILIFN